MRRQRMLMTRMKKKKKRNKQLSAYGQRLVRGTQRKDQDGIRAVRGQLLDIAAFARGLAQQIVDENSEGELFLYTQFDNRSRSYFSRLSTHVGLQYVSLAKRVSQRSKDIYLFYRKEFVNTLKIVKFKPKILPLTEAQINISFGGTPTQSFTKHLRRQLQAGLEPAALIKTVGQEHVKLIQREMAVAVSKGKGFGWTSNRVLKNMYPAAADKAIRDQMEYNITRIARTSYMQAVNGDTSEFVRDNEEVFYGSRRVADGRPCMACIAQDGRFYAPDEPMIDHPNGMCVLVPIPYPDEYFETGKITQPIDDTFDKPLAEKFYKLSAGEQRQAFGNDLLFRLWKKEQFDLDKIVVGKFGTPISYRQAALNLDKMGGISASNVSFRSGFTRKKLLEIIDPKDRVNPNIVLSQKDIIGGVTQQGLRIDGSGSEFLSLQRIPTVKRARIAALYGEESNLSWYTFNQRARELGLYTRKDLKGNIYYAVPKNKVKDQFISLKQAYKQGGSTGWAERFSFKPSVDEFYATLDPKFSAKIIEQKKVMKKMKTSAQVYKDAQGNWLPERQVLHNKIIDSYINPETIARTRAAAGEAPEYVMFGGRAESGKSAFTRKKVNGGLEVVEEDRFLILDSDAIKEALDGYEGWNAFLFHDESKELFERITEMAMQNKLNLVHDMTMNNTKKMVRKAKLFSESGYKVSGYYMHLPLQEATKRAVMRFYTRRADFSGRLVPPEIVLDMVTNEMSFDALKEFLGKWAFYDNQGLTPKLLDSFGF